MNRLLFLTLIASLGAGFSLFSMHHNEPTSSDSKGEFAHYLSSLPKEIQRHIVHLCLRAMLGAPYRPTYEITLNKYINSITTGSDNRTFILGLSDDLTGGSIAIGDCLTGTLLKEFVCHTTATINSLACGSDLKKVLTGSSDKTARLWDIETEKELQRFSGHTAAVSSVALSPNGERALTGSWDETVCLWNTSTGEQIQKITIGKGWINSVAFSENGELFLVGSNDGYASLWKSSTGEKLQEFSYPGIFFPLHSATFGSDEKTMLTLWKRDKKLREWDCSIPGWLNVAQGAKKITQVHNKEIHSTAFSKDKKTIAAGSTCSTVHISNHETGELIQEWEFPWGTSDNAIVALSPNGKTVLTGSRDKALSIRTFNSEISEDRKATALELFIAKGLFAILQEKTTK